ncbi:hypothetical protein JMJ78_0000892 [Colletotrichum scovillei]|nr:hypothetical protein JMJ78_0000892 [Colletotrichum scovillei]
MGPSTSTHTQRMIRGSESFELAHNLDSLRLLFCHCQTKSRMVELNSAKTRASERSDAKTRT